MGRRSPDSPDVAHEYNNGKIDKYRDSRHRSPRSPSMEKRRYDRSFSPAPIKRRSRRSRSYDSPDRRRGRKHVRDLNFPHLVSQLNAFNSYSNMKIHHHPDVLESLG